MHESMQHHHDEPAPGILSTRSSLLLNSGNNAGGSGGGVKDDAFLKISTNFHWRPGASDISLVGRDSMTTGGIGSSSSSIGSGDIIAISNETTNLQRSESTFQVFSEPIL